MVSQDQEILKPSGAFLRFEGEPLPDFRTVRVRFRKTGSLQLISHLDTQRVMMRIMVRAGIPMWYTQGFNPHAKVVFALPLPVGVESECELMDLRICRDVSEKEILNRLNQALTDEMRALDVYIPERKFLEIDSCDYALTFKSPKITEETASELEHFLTTPPLTIVKKTGSGEREIELTRHLRRLNIQSEKDLLKVFVNMPAGQDKETVSPLSVCEKIIDHLALYEKSADEDFRVVRLHMRDDRMREFA